MFPDPVNIASWLGYGVMGLQDAQQRKVPHCNVENQTDQELVCPKISLLPMGRSELSVSQTS
jgi:hypothetical protein